MRDLKSHENEMIFSAKQLAEVLNLSPRRIQQLADEEIIVKNSRGKYNALESIRRYIQFLQEKRSESDEANYFKERALHEKAKREMAELKLAKLKNQLHDAADVEAVMANMLVTFRSRMLSLPDKVSPKLLAMDNLSEISETIRDEIMDALTELSEYNPEMFAGGGEDEEDDSAVSEGIAVGRTAAEDDDK